MIPALDTSGEVFVSVNPPNERGGKRTTFRDLSPFAQGYVRAAIGGVYWEFDDYSDQGGCVRTFARFADLAPEALAAMIADCERFRLSFANGLTEYGETRLQEIGAGFWRDRQGGAFPARDPHYPFPPLTLTLGDDGKVYLQETK